jgi:hypothetical protein
MVLNVWDKTMMLNSEVITSFKIENHRNKKFGGLAVCLLLRI